MENIGEPAAQKTGSTTTPISRIKRLRRPIILSTLLLVVLAVGFLLASGAERLVTYTSDPVEVDGKMYRAKVLLPESWKVQHWFHGTPSDIVFFDAVPIKRYTWLPERFRNWMGLGPEPVASLHVRFGPNYRNLPLDGIAHVETVKVPATMRPSSISLDEVYHAYRSSGPDSKYMVSYTRGNKGHFYATCRQICESFVIEKVGQ